MHASLAVRVREVVAELLLRAVDGKVVGLEERQEEHVQRVCREREQRHVREQEDANAELVDEPGKSIAAPTQPWCKREADAEHGAKRVEQHIGNPAHLRERHGEAADKLEREHHEQHALKKFHVLKMAMKRIPAEGFFTWCLRAARGGRRMPLESFRSLPNMIHDDNGEDDEEETIELRRGSGDAKAFPPVSPSPQRKGNNIRNKGESVSTDRNVGSSLQQTGHWTVPGGEHHSIHVDQHHRRSYSNTTTAPLMEKFTSVLSATPQVVNLDTVADSVAEATSLLQHPFGGVSNSFRRKDVETYSLELKAQEAKASFTRLKLQAFWQLLVTGFEVIKFAIGKRARKRVLWLGVDGKLYLTHAKHDKHANKSIFSRTFDAHLSIWIACFTTQPYALLQILHRDIYKVQKGSDAQSFTKSQSRHDARSKTHLCFSIHGKKKHHRGSSGSANTKDQDEKTFALQVASADVRNVVVENVDALLQMVKSDADGEFPDVPTLRQVEDVLLREEDEKKSKDYASGRSTAAVSWAKGLNNIAENISWIETEAFLDFLAVHEQRLGPVSRASIGRRLQRLLLLLFLCNRTKWWSWSTFRSSGYSSRFDHLEHLNKDRPKSSSPPLQRRLLGVKAHAKVFLQQPHGSAASAPEESASSLSESHHVEVSNQGASSSSDQLTLPRRRAVSGSVPQADTGAQGTNATAGATATPARQQQQSDEPSFLQRKRWCAKTFEDMILARVRDARDQTRWNRAWQAPSATGSSSPFWVSAASARKPVVAHDVVGTIKALSRITATRPRQDLAATLCHLSEENGLVEVLLFEGIDRSLGRMFTAASPETKRACALTVFDISVDAVTIKHFMDAFSQLLVMLTHASSNAASGNLIKAVYNAALVPAFHPALLSENIPRFLAQQLPNVPPPIQILALRALVALCDSKSNRAQILSQTFCKLLESMLTSTNEEIQETTLLIALLLLSIDEGSRIKLCNWIPAATIVQTASQRVGNSNMSDKCSHNASRDRLVYLHSCVLRNLCDSVLTHHELVEEGAVRVLLKMDRMDDNDVKSNAICALCCILASSTEESAGYVTEIMHELIALTKTGTAKNCVFAVGALYNITCSDESLPLLAQSHLLLKRMLQLVTGDTPSSRSKEDTQRVVELVTAILYRLAGVDDAQQLMLQHGVFPVLVRVVHQFPAGRAYALNTLFLPAQDGDRLNSLRAVAAAPVAIKNQATTDENTATTLRSAVMLLAHLARHPKNQDALVRNGAVFRFLKRLERLEDEETILINCAFVHFSLTATHKGCDHLAKECAIEDIIHLSRTSKLVASSSQVVKELCMLALCRLSSFMGLEVRLIEYGAIDAVMVMALVTTDSTLIKSLCVKMLANCLVAKTCVRPLIEHGIIWALSSLCLVDSPETRYACAVSLCNLSAVTNMLSRFLDAGAPRALVYLLKQKSDPTYATVMTSIKAIANLVASEKICAVFLNQELEKHLSVHFSDPHSSEELRQLAAMVLLRVTSANDAVISLERLKNGVFVWMEQIIAMKEADLVRNCMLTVHDLTCNSTIDVAELDVEHILRIAIQVFQRRQQNDEIVTLCLSIAYNLSCQLSVIPRLVIPEVMTFLRQQTPASVSTAGPTPTSSTETQSTQQPVQREATFISPKSVDMKLCCLILHNMSCCDTSSKPTDELLAALVNFHAIAILYNIYVLRDDLKEICSIATCNIVVGKINTSRVLEDRANAILLHFVSSSYFRANHYHLMSVCLRKLVNAPGNQNMLLSAGIIRVIVFMLALPEIGSESSVNLLAALALLSRCSHHVSRLLDDGVLPSVIRIADAKGASPVALSYCFEILSNLCTMNFEDHVKQHPEINVISTLTKLSEAHHHHSSSGTNNHIVQQRLQHMQHSHPVPASPASKPSFTGSNGSCYYDRGESKPLQPAQLLMFMMESPSTPSPLKKNLELHTTYTVPAQIALTETSQSIPAEIKQRIRAPTPLPKETLARDESADECIAGSSALARNSSARSVAMSTSLSDDVASARGSPDALRALAARGKKLRRGLAGRNLSQSGPSPSPSSPRTQARKRQDACMAAPSSSSSSSRRRPAPAKLKARTEFSVTLFVPAAVSTVTQSSAATWYRFEYREAGAGGTSWTNAKSVDTKSGATEVVLDDLNPTSTYEIRIYAVSRDDEGKEQLSEPSEVAAVDTEVPGCGPEASKCVVM
ncbi:hypothetical protein FI667_g4168, partial [Globisporangium splendens]